MKVSKGGASHSNHNYLKYFVSSPRKQLYTCKSLLQKNFPNAYGALIDGNKTIDDFARGLQNGNKGAYATDPGYVSKVEMMFKGVVNDYIKVANSELTSNTSLLQSLNRKLDNKNLTDEQKQIIQGQIDNLSNDNKRLNNNLIQLRQLK